jgi:hypothetical protein
VEKYWDGGVRAGKGVLMSATARHACLQCCMPPYELKRREDPIESYRIACWSHGLTSGYITHPVNVERINRDQSGNEHDRCRFCSVSGGSQDIHPH